MPCNGKHPTLRQHKNDSRPSAVAVLFPLPSVSLPPSLSSCSHPATKGNVVCRMVHDRFSVMRRKRARGAHDLRSPLPPPPTRAPPRRQRKQAVGPLQGVLTANGNTAGTWRGAVLPRSLPSNHFHPLHPLAHYSTFDKRVEIASI